MNILILIRHICRKPPTWYIRMKVNAFCQRLEKRQEWALLPILFNFVLEILGSKTSPEKEVKIMEGRCTIVFIFIWISMYIENWQECKEKLLQLVSVFSWIQVKL